MINPSKIPVTDRDRTTAMDLFGDLFLLSFMFLVCSMLIVTIPVACIALYDAIAHCVVGSEKEPVKRFWSTAKRELIRGILMGIGWIVVCALGFMSFTYLLAMGTEMPLFTIYAYVYLATMVIPLAVMIWSVPVQSRFAYKFWQLHKVSAIFALSNLPQTAMMVAVVVGLALLFAFLPVSSVLLLILPGILTLVQSRTVESAFAPYMEENVDD